MIDLYEEKYAEFIQAHPLGDFQQSVEWAKLKEYWKNERIILYKENKQVIAIVSILIRKIPLFGNLMYVPRGPICDVHNKEVLEKLTEEIKRIAKQYKAFGIRIEPNVEKSDVEFITKVKELGYHVYSSAVKFEDEVQARHNFRLNLKNKTEEEVLQGMESKTRYNIRLATKKNVEIREENNIDVFYQLLEETGERDKFRIRKKEYFIKMCKEFSKENIKILIAYYEGEPIASIMLMLYGKKMWYLYGASSNKCRKVMPNYLLQWTAIQMAIHKNLEVYDFRGVSIKKDGNHDGLYRFKKGFGGDFVELIGEIYLPFHPVKFYFYKMLEKKFRHIRKWIYQKKCERIDKKSKKE